MSHPLRLSCAAILTISAALLASAPAFGSTPEPFTLADGTPFHETDNPVLEARTVAVPGGALELHLWKEILPSGTVQAFYAVTDGSGVCGRVRETSYVVRLRDQRFDPLADELTEPAPALAARGDNRLFLVQLHATPLPEFQQAIQAAGATVWRFLTDHTLIVDVDPQELGRLSDFPFVRWVGPYHPLYRLEEPLRAAIAGQGADLERQRYSIMIGERGAERQDALADRIRQLGGAVELIEPGGLRVEATLTQSQLAEVAHSNLVQFVDRWGGPGEVDMAVVREVGGADYVETMTGFSGEGVAGEIFDTELLTTHQEWLLPPILHSVSSSCNILHGTSCFSNNFAQGVQPDARGMVPDGQGIFFCFAESTQFGGAKSRYDANAELIDPAGPYRAVFQTSSVGSNLTTQYTTLSAETDDYLFLHQLLSTQSQSNAGSQSSRPQAWAKNIVAVGGIRHEGTADRCDDHWSFSGSIGPAADGRVKPELGYFNHQIFSASGSSNTSYTNFGGTSSATPQTAGHFGMLHQMWHEGVWPGFGGGADVFDSRPHVATARALMINSAFKYDWLSPGPCAYGDVDRDKIGWGTADLRKLYDRAPSTFVVDESDVIAPLETKTYSVVVEPGESEFAATLVYADPMGTPGAGEARINDLSLRVTSPSAAVYWGNNGLHDANVSTAGGLSNTIDTVENVFIQDPEAGSWTVEVLGDEIVQDGHTETPAVDADFGLVVSGVAGGLIFMDGFESGDTTMWSSVVSP